MTVIVCLVIRLLWLVCGVQGFRGYYIVWCLHLGPFSSAAAVHGDYRLFCVQKPCLPSKWGFLGKKKRRKKIQHENTTMCWTLASTQLGCFGNMLVLLFGLLFFSYVFSNCYLPKGHRGLFLMEKKRHEIDIIPLNAVQICRENTVIRWQCLKIKHILLSLSFSP